jgi:hypothetical protein
MIPEFHRLQSRSSFDSRSRPSTLESWFNMSGERTSSGDEPSPQAAIRIGVEYTHKHIGISVPSALPLIFITHCSSLAENTFGVASLNHRRSITNSCFGLLPLSRASRNLLGWLPTSLLCKRYQNIHMQYCRKPPHIVDRRLLLNSSVNNGEST